MYPFIGSAGMYAWIKLKYVRLMACNIFDVLYKHWQILKYLNTFPPRHGYNSTINTKKKHSIMMKYIYKYLVIYRSENTCVQ